MTEAVEDTRRAQEAVRAILDGRDTAHDWSSILVTAEHTIASLLLLLMRDPRMAAKMLNEGLSPGVESRLSLYQARGKQP